MHKVSGVREPATAVAHLDDTAERRQADRTVGLSGTGLAVTCVLELIVAIVTGSVALLGGALHNLADVPTSALVFLGFRISRRTSSERYPYGLERAEDLAGLAVALVVRISAAQPSECVPGCQ